jgi:hypothetical protein
MAQSFCRCSGVALLARFWALDKSVGVWRFFHKKKKQQENEHDSTAKIFIFGTS